MPLTPPGTSKKQEPADNDEIKHFCSTAERNEQKNLIFKFVDDQVISELDPGSYQQFARCLGLTSNDYTLIKHDNSDKNNSELLHQIMRHWFLKQGHSANVTTFAHALKTLKHKELQDNFFIYCQDKSKAP